MLVETDSGDRFHQLPLVACCHEAGESLSQSDTLKREEADERERGRGEGE